MHLRHLVIQDCKLMRQLAMSFLQDDGSPRLWTVFVGENGTCKTTLLRAIALTAVGSAFANHLVNDPNAYIDRRRDADKVLTGIEAGFGFSRTLHHARTYPLLEASQTPPEVVSWARVSATDVDVRATYTSWEERVEARHLTQDIVDDFFKGWTELANAAIRTSRSASAGGNPARAGVGEVDVREMIATMKAIRALWPDPLEVARREQLRHWFIAGYGVGRVLAVPASAPEGGVAGRDRVKSLFDASFLPEGPRFSDRLARSFGEQRARDFTQCLRTALIERMHTPGLRDMELRRQGSAEDQLDPVESHRFSMFVGDTELKLPAVWLSQGYQAVISLVADIIGNVWLEAGEPVELDEMEGIVLVDELDLHLHPAWQAEIVTGLKAAFPRMQFIATTHSPLVLAGCRADEVWTLRRDQVTGDITARQGEVAPMLLTTSEMYREYFGVSRTYASELGEALRRYVELASNPFRSDAEDAEVTELRKHLLAHRVDVDYQPVARKTAS